LLKGIVAFGLTRRAIVLLGLLVSPHRLGSSVIPAVIVALVLMLVARPLAVFFCLAPFRFNWREKIFIAWTGLRGAVAIFLASIPMLVGLSKAYLYFDVAFVVVIISLLLQGWTLAAAARRKVRTYSLGMRQRLSLAAALLGNPRVLVLDEPANGLDPEGIHWMRNLLKSLAAEGRTVFVSSHLMSEMAQTASRLVVIGRGRQRVGDHIRRIGRIVAIEPVPGLSAEQSGGDHLLEDRGRRV